jgi:hypothetical protein
MKRVMPITVAARCKAWTILARSNAGIVGSNPTQGMDVCVRLLCVCVLYVDSGLATGWSPSKESYRLCIGLKNWKSGQGPKGCRAIEREREREGKKRRVWFMNSQYNFLCLSVISFALGRNILLSNLFSNNLNVSFFTRREFSRIH